MAQQTAVEWLAKEISNQLGTNDLLDELFEQAKQMEKEQIVKAHGLKYYDLNEEVITGEQYYNETYGENKD